jgi:hypothetical protein
MKTLALATALVIMVSMTGFAQTRTAETFTLDVGKQKTAKKSRLKIKFLEVTEDSRCPTGVDCIWAGNAKIKVKIVGSHSSQIFEFNTNMGPKGDIFDGWAITIDKLTPYPQANKEIDKKCYRVEFAISRPSR